MKKTSQDIPAPVAVMTILASMMAAGWQMISLLQDIAWSVPNMRMPYEAMVP